MSGKSDAATRALQLFASIYGAEAGNLALKSLALGGVYVCGNIAARMLPILERRRLPARLSREGPVRRR